MLNNLRTAPTTTCPLCDRQADASDGSVEACLSLVRCRDCRAFVIEQHLVEIITNGRTKNLQPVLRYLSPLSLAAQDAAAQGRVLLITSTNWIRVAVEQQRLTHAVMTAMPRAYARPPKEDDVHPMASTSRSRATVSGMRHSIRG
jgi:hypothetical protein